LLRIADKTVVNGKVLKMEFSLPIHHATMEVVGNPDQGSAGMDGTKVVEKAKKQQQRQHLMRI
jgi:hypothetical protein